MKTKRKICLVTAHAPSIGGGSAILHSLIAPLQSEFQIVWYYLSSKPEKVEGTAWLGEPVIGVGSPALDMVRTGLIFTGWQPKAWKKLLEKLLAVDCDAYWIVSHNEGLCLARDLSRLTKRPIHLTIHDDWAGALCVRSRRHRQLEVLAAFASDKAIKCVRSVDVVSEGMSRYYLDRTGVTAAVVHRYAPPSEAAAPHVDAPGILVGHLGSVYAMQDLLIFLDTLKEYADERNLSVKVILWGSFKADRMPATMPSHVEIKPTTDEDVIIRELQGCHFVYAAYPFEKRFKRFRQTSMPTKLSTYVAAQRPILGHTPADSTLASFIERTGVGSIWPDLEKNHGLQVIGDILAQKAPLSCWRQARDRFFGEANLHKMRELLRHATALDPASTGSNVADSDQSNLR